MYPDAPDDFACFLAGMHHGLPDWMGRNAGLSWYDSELVLWMRTQAYMLSTPRQQYLDVGCGLGRIVCKFGWLFEATTCLEPDSERISTARAGLKEEDALKERWLNFDNSTFLEFKPAAEGYDVITSIHVIQHIPLADPSKWLANMNKILNDDGVLILATTFMPDKITHRVVDRINGSIDVSPDVFNEYAMGVHSGALAVHGWTADELKEVVKTAGFSVLEQAPFAFRSDGVPESQYIIGAKPGSRHTREDIPKSVFPSEVHVTHVDEPTLAKVEMIRRGTTKCE